MFLCLSLSLSLFHALSRSLTRSLLLTVAVESRAARATRAMEKYCLPLLEEKYMYTYALSYLDAFLVRVYACTCPACRMLFPFPYVRACLRPCERTRTRTRTPTVLRRTKTRRNAATIEKRRISSRDRDESWRADKRPGQAGPGRGKGRRIERRIARTFPHASFGTLTEAEEYVARQTGELPRSLERKKSVRVRVYPRATIRICARVCVSCIAIVAFRTRSSSACSRSAMPTTLARSFSLIFFFFSFSRFFSFFFFLFWKSKNGTGQSVRS